MVNNDLIGLLIDLFITKAIKSDKKPEATTYAIIGKDTALNDNNTTK